MSERDGDLRGTWEPGPGQQIVNATLSVDGAAPTKRKERGAGELVLEDGRRVRVEAANARLVGFPPDTTSGAWSSFEDQDDGRLFADLAPGPHIAVKVRASRVARGASVVMRGRISDERGDYRSGKGRPVAIRATEIANADGGTDGSLEDDDPPRASTKQQPKPKALARASRTPWRRALRVGLGLAAGASAIASIPIVAKIPAHADVTAGARAFLVGAAAAAALLVADGLWFGHAGGFRPLLLQFGRPDSRKESATSALLWILGLLIATSGAFFFVMDAVQLASHRDLSMRMRGKNGSPGMLLTTGTRVGGGGVACGVALVAAAAWWTERRSARLCGVLLGARAAPRVNAWSVVGGTVKGVGDHVRCTIARRSFGKGDKRNGVATFMTSSPFTIDTEHGKFAVDPSRAEVSSAFMTEKKVEGGSDTAWTVPSGASIVLAGRLRERAGEAPLFAGVGPESLVMYATQPGASLTGPLRLHRTVHAALALGAVGALAGFVLAIVG